MKYTGDIKKNIKKLKSAFYDGLEMTNKIKYSNTAFRNDPKDPLNYLSEAIEKSSKIVEDMKKGVINTDLKIPINKHHHPIKKDAKPKIKKPMTSLRKYFLKQEKMAKYMRYYMRALGKQLDNQGRNYQKMRSIAKEKTKNSRRLINDVKRLEKENEKLNYDYHKASAIIKILEKKKDNHEEQVVDLTKGDVIIGCYMDL